MPSADVAISALTRLASRSASSCSRSAVSVGPGVGGDGVPLLAQQRRDVVRLRHGQRVDDPRPGQRIHVRGKPSRALRRVARRAPPTAAATRGPARRAAPGCPRRRRRVARRRRRRRGRWRSPWWPAPGRRCPVRRSACGCAGSRAGSRGPSPTRSAPRRPRPGRRRAPARAAPASRKSGLFKRSGLTSRTSRSPARTRWCISSQSVTLLELMVAALHAGPLGGGHLVAHQRQQRRHDDRRPAPRGAQQLGGDEVHRRLAPAGALHDERPPALHDQRLDRGPLVVAQSAPAVRPAARGSPARSARVAMAPSCPVRPTVTKVAETAKRVA